MKLLSSLLPALLTFPVICFFPWHAGAQAVTWGGSNGSWNAAGDWTGGKMPGSGTNAIIDSGTVHFPATVSGTADLVVIGNSGTGALTMSGGLLGDVDATIGNKAGSSGTATVSSGTWITSESLSIGGSGTGVLTVNGGSLTDVDGLVGNLAGSSGTATVSSGTWFNSNFLTVGVSGTGDFSLTGGVLAASQNGSNYNPIINVTIGSAAGSSGTATISGGTLATSIIYIGNSGTGTLNIESGANISNGSGGEISLIAGNNGGSGTVNMSGATLNAEVAVGYYGTGSMNFSGGTITGTDFYVGSGTGSSGALKVDGGTLNATFFFIGNSGTGSLALTSGSVSAGATAFGVQEGSSGTGAITGGTLNSQYLDVGGLGSGSLSISTATVIDTTPYNSAAIGGSSPATVTMNSGTWTNSGTIAVAGSGIGILNMNGGYVTSTGGVIGSGSGSFGTVTVIGGTWSNSGALTVGNSGTGILNMGGGLVTVGGGAGMVVLGSGSASIGTLNYSDGTLNVVAITSGSGNGVVNFTTTASSTFAPVITGNLSVNQTGTGSTTLTGSSYNYTGSTSINTGTFKIGAGGTTSADLIGNVVNSGMFTIDTSGTITLGGSITGGGSLNQTGAGVTILTGSNSYTGTTTINAGKLQIGNGVLTGSMGTGILVDKSMLVFDPGGQEVVPNNISSSGSLEVMGSGNIILTASNSYTGTTIIASGTLSVNGSIASSSGVAVSSGATLAGSGVVGNISGAGTVAPGDPAILTATQVDPSSGMSFDFHFAQAGAPTYSNAAASGNDVLHLTGATPFVFSLTSANTITLDFTGQILNAGEIYYGGFFTNASIANSTVDNATFDYTGLDGATVQFEGMVPVTNAAFATGTVSGDVMEVEVTSVPVPAAPAWALLALGAGLLIAGWRRVKA